MYIYTKAFFIQSFQVRKTDAFIVLFQSENTLKNHVFVKRKTPLRCLLDAIMMLTFFDAVVIAIATCSYRDSNMMLSTCVHVVIKLATCCQFDEAIF